MESNINTKNIVKRILNTVKNFITLHQEDRLEFYLVTTKVLFAYLFFANLFNSVYSVTILGTNLYASSLDLLKPIFRYVFILIFGVGPLLLAFLGYERKKKATSLLTKIYAVLACVGLLLITIIALDNVSFSDLYFGFYWALALVICINIISWKDSIASNILCKIFKKELASIGQLKKEPEVAPTPEPIETPEKIVEPEPVKEDKKEE